MEPRCCPRSEQSSGPSGRLAGRYFNSRHRRLRHFARFHFDGVGLAHRPASKKWDGGWVRIAAFSAMLSLTMISLAAFDPPAAWPTQIGLGGVLGMVLLDSIKILINTLNMPLWPVTAVIGMMAIVAMGVTLGISRREWAEGIRNIAFASDSAARAGWAGGRWSSRFAQNVSKASWRLIGRFWTREADSNKNTVAKRSNRFLRRGSSKVSAANLS